MDLVAHYLGAQELGLTQDELAALADEADVVAISRQLRLGDLQFLPDGGVLAVQLALLVDLCTYSQPAATAPPPANSSTTVIRVLGFKEDSLLWFRAEKGEKARPDCRLDSSDVSLQLMDRPAPGRHLLPHGEGFGDDAAGAGGGRRTSRRMSQEALAPEADISPTYLSQIETGQRNPTVAALHGFATKLGVSLGELFQGL